jgi:hypothetical protein
MFRLCLCCCALNRQQKKLIRCQSEYDASVMSLTDRLPAAAVKKRGPTKRTRQSRDETPVSVRATLFDVWRHGGGSKRLKTQLEANKENADPRKRQADDFGANSESIDWARILETSADEHASQSLDYGAIVSNDGSLVSSCLLRVFTKTICRVDAVLSPVHVNYNATTTATTTTTHRQRRRFAIPHASQHFRAVRQPTRCAKTMRRRLPSTLITVSDDHETIDEIDENSAN